jgi:hypothetical protein
MRPINRILTLWRVGLLDAGAVIRWADQAIEQAERPSQEIIDLSCYGPERCLELPESEFPARPVALLFSEEFSLRALATELESDEAVHKFAQWTAQHAMGERLDLPEVILGYQIDDLLDGCSDWAGAIALVRKELPDMLERCKELAAPFQGPEAPGTRDHYVGG